MAERRREQPFFEAYLSNFIEVTEFELDEPIRVVHTGAVPPTAGTAPAGSAPGRPRRSTTTCGFEH